MTKLTNKEISWQQYSTVLMTVFMVNNAKYSTVQLPSESEIHTLAKRIYGMMLGRSYHGPAHPYNMYAVFSEISMSDKHLDAEVDIVALLWMILLHDVIIKVGTVHGWSEGQSAAFAYTLLIKLGYPQNFALFVKRGILATADHSLDDIPEDERATVALLLDLDLMGLGQDPEGFAADTENIWLEYKHKYSREEYDQGRKQWAESFRKPQRASIFHTKHFAHLEQQAQKNLTALAEG